MAHPRLMLAAVAAATVVAAGCGNHSAAVATPITEREWHAVVSDWLAHGRFAQQHGCAAVVVARTRVVPAYHEGMPLVHALDVYERKLCPTGDVWAVRVGMTNRTVASVAGAPIPWLSGPNRWLYHTSKAGTSIDGLGFYFDRAGKVATIKTAVHF